MPILQQVPVVGYAVRALAVEAPLLGQVVLANAFGLAITRGDTANGGRCDALTVWCDAPPELPTVARVATVGALPFTVPCALWLARREPEAFVDLLPKASVLLALTTPCGWAPLSAAVGMHVAGQSGTRARNAATSALCGGLACWAVVLGALVLATAILLQLDASGNRREVRRRSRRAPGGGDGEPGDTATRWRRGSPSLAPPSPTSRLGTPAPPPVTGAPALRPPPLAVLAAEPPPPYAP